MGAQGRDVILQISNLDLATQLKLELAAVQKVSVRLEHELHQQVTVLRRQKKNAAGQNRALKSHNEETKNRKYITHHNVMAASLAMVLTKLAEILRVFRYHPK